MANIPIWPGSSSFSKGDTPFGFYDKDTEFTSSAPQVADWCARRLGYPLVDIELQAVNFFTCFEEAVNEYGSQLYHFQIINNFHTLEGTSTRSGSASLNEQVVTPNLGNTINVAEQYGSETDGAGGNYKLEKGILNVVAGQQGYDLLSDVSSSLSGSEDVYLKRVYHYAPSAINRYFDPYAGTGTGIQSLMQSFGFGNFSPGVNFMLMPMYFDVLKLQAIELNDSIRKSAYHFDVEDNRYLKLFPIPKQSYTLHYEYVLKSTANDPVKHPSQSGSKVTNLSNAPYSNPIYTNINEPGRQWIRRYALALAKEMLGSVRGKYQSVPIPGDTTTLDFARLLSEAASEKTALIEELKTFLEETTRVKQLERQNQEAQLTQETFFKVPYPIYIG
jgi:hypothetical protein